MNESFDVMGKCALIYITGRSVYSRITNDKSRRTSLASFSAIDECPGS